MKKILTVLVSAVAATAVYGQGYFNFNNVSTASGFATVGSLHAAGEGNTGDYLGSSYTVAAYYSLTPISGAVDPTTLTLLNNGSTVFIGTTGQGASHGPTADGAGLFDGGTGTITGTADGQTVYVEAVVWWGGAASYNAALAAGNNTGYSIAVPIRLASGSDPTVGDLGGISAFTVGVVPEPTTIALGGLGAAALLLFRRRK